MQSDPWLTFYDSLTERQREVLELASLGMSNREIAARLFVEPCVVAEHLTKIYGLMQPLVRRTPNRYLLIRHVTLLFATNPALCQFDESLSGHIS
jgi:FixJ family two-component response regulator